MPDIRDAGVVAVVAAAGGLAMGLAKLGASGWLARGVFAGLKGWQVLNAGAFAINIASVSVPGRVDGEMAADAQRAARAAKTAATAATSDTADTPAGIPRDHWSRGLFSPRAGRSPSGASSSSARPSSPPRRPSPTSTPTPPPPTPPCPPGGPPRVAYRLCGASRSALDSTPVASGSAARSSPRNPSPSPARTVNYAPPSTPSHSPPTSAATFPRASTSDGSPPRRCSASTLSSPSRARCRERRSPPRAPPRGYPRRGCHRHGHLGRPRVRADARVGARGGGGGWREIRDGDD